MSAFAQILGKLYGDIRTQPTRNGGTICFFKLRVASGSALDYWDCSTFSSTVIAEIERLKEGDSLSATGALVVELFEWKGEKRIKRGLTVDRVLAMKAGNDKGSKAEAPYRTVRETAKAAAAPLVVQDWEINDDIPF